MKLISKFVVLAAMTVTAHFAQAQSAGSKAVSGAFGFFSSSLGQISEGKDAKYSDLSGLFGFGGDFDYFIKPTMSAGAILRYYYTTDSIAGVDRKDSLLTMGAVFRAYLIDTNDWSFVATGGFGIVDAKVKSSPGTSVDSDLAFGAYMGMGVFYKCTNSVRVGVENLRVLGLGEHVNGWVLSDYMGKVTVIF
jgi:hypothetical protein